MNEETIRKVLSITPEEWSSATPEQRERANVECNRRVHGLSIHARLDQLESKVDALEQSSKKSGGNK